MQVREVGDGLGRGGRLSVQKMWKEGWVEEERAEESE